MEDLDAWTLSCIAMIFLSGFLVGKYGKAIADKTPSAEALIPETGWVRNLILVAWGFVATCSLILSTKIYLGNIGRGGPGQVELLPCLATLGIFAFPLYLLSRAKLPNSQKANSLIAFTVGFLYPHLTFGLFTAISRSSDGILFVFSYPVLMVGIGLVVIYPAVQVIGLVLLAITMVSVLINSFRPTADRPENS